jgi:competence protein ComFA
MDEFGGEFLVREMQFIQYQVKVKDHLFWNLVSPKASFEEIDRPFWHARSGRIERVADKLSITSFSRADVTPFTEAQERILFFKRNLVFLSASHRKEVEWGISLSGRKLLLKEVADAWSAFLKKQPFLEEEELNMDQLGHTLQRLYLQGFFDWSSPVGRLPSKGQDHQQRTYCRRCGYGEKTQGHYFWQRVKGIFKAEERLIEVNCAICGRGNCCYCPRCIRMGITKGCTPYLEWTSEAILYDRRRQKAVLNWEGTLSTAQKTASSKLLNFVRLPATEEFLLWAVCGSGKTEILFEAILDYLQKSKKILITSPRRDVIVELAPRLKEAFPLSSIRVLHGESDEKYEEGDLFLATTHQTLRFKDYFDLVIIDEQDAFPFHYDRMLAYAVQRSKKKEGLIVCLTATPQEEMIQRAKSNEIEHTIITERFHGHPLAIPQINPVGNWRKLLKNKEILTELVQFVKHLVAQQRYGYLFVPHVKDLEVVQAYLEEVAFPYVRQNLMNKVNEDLNEDMYSEGAPEAFAETVHAEHPQRAEIVQRFRDNKIRILITTTILERGVTIPYSDVAVLGSDDPVFNTSALIQMAGRVGRKAEDPKGHVWFLPELRTNSQVKCVRMIREWNKK